MIVINPITRQFNIPGSDLVFGVESDSGSERKYFQCPRYVGNNVDLASSFVRINYRNANGEVDAHLVEDLTVDRDNVLFSWELHPKATMYKGQLNFVLCVTGPDLKVKWHTTMGRGQVLEGLEPETDMVEPATEDMIAQLIAMVEAQTEFVEKVGANQVTIIGVAAKNAEMASVAEIKAQGASMLATIPEDYIALSDEVAMLGNRKADGYTVSTAMAAEHSIYAQDAALRVGIQGATNRVGTGNPAMSNPVAINGLGSYDAVLVLDGTEQWVASTNQATNTVQLSSPFVGGICKVGVCSHFAPLNGTKLKDGTRGAYMSETTTLFINYGTVAELKAYLAEQYAAGTPVTIWYQKATHNSGDPYYVRAETEDAAGRYRAVAAKVGIDPLFDGDRVDILVNSGCDKKLVFDGTEDWSDYNELYFVTYGVPRAAKPYVGHGSHFRYRYNYAAKNIFVGDSVVYCGTELRNAFNGDVEAWKAYLAEQYAAGTPVTIWYKTIDYAPDKDIKISMVTRNHRRIVLRGNETWVYDPSTAGTRFYTPITGCKGSTGSLITSHFGTSVYHTGGTIGWDNYPFALAMSQALCIDGLSEFTTVDELKAWLKSQAEAGTPVTAVYQLAEPEGYVFDPVVLRSLNGLPETVKGSGALSVSYPQDITYTIQKLVNAIRALGGTV